MNVLDLLVDAGQLINTEGYYEIVGVITKTEDTGNGCKFHKIGIVYIDNRQEGCAGQSFKVSLHECEDRRILHDGRESVIGIAQFDNAVYAVISNAGNYQGKTTGNIKIGIVPNPEIRIYHIRFRMPENEHDFSDIQGVVEATSICSPYEISIEKGEAFTWDEVEPLILARIEQLEKSLPVQTL